MTMIARCHTAHSSPQTTRVLAAIAAMARRFVQRRTSAWRNRSGLAALAMLDERMLADMGLTRADIRDAIAQPVWSDPTAVLAERRRERQVHDYRAIFAQLMRERNSTPLAPGADACSYPPSQPPARLTL